MDREGLSRRGASQLYNLLDAGYITDEEFEEAYSCARHCSYLIYKFLTSIKSSSVKGERYK